MARKQFGHYRLLSWCDINIVHLSVLYKGAAGKKVRSQIPRFASRSPQLNVSVEESQKPISETFIKTKLQLIDLAGSECVGKMISLGYVTRITNKIHSATFSWPTLGWPSAVASGILLTRHGCLGAFWFLVFVKLWDHLEVSHNCSDSLNLYVVLMVLQMNYHSCFTCHHMFMLFEP